MRLEGVEQSMEKVSLVSKGYYGEFGGSFVPEELQQVLNELDS